MSAATITLPDKPEAWTVQPVEGFTVIVVDQSKAEIRYTDNRAIQIVRKS